jgi:AcrR family transcriptional regulator
MALQEGTLPPAARRAGRPRQATVDAAIIRATLELMVAKGVAGTTLADVARRAGVARATVYLRWGTRSALIGAAARAAVGGMPMPLTGDLEHDIRFAGDFMRRVFEVPSFAAILPEIIRGVLAGEISFDSVAPRRRAMSRLYRDGAAAQGLDAGADSDLAFDMLLGTALVRLLATRRAMTAGEAAELSEVVIRGLRAPRASARGAEDDSR